MTSGLSNLELDTYSRQIVLADIGYDGQLKLRNASVCLVGVGGLGSPVALKLVGMGIGHLRIVDLVVDGLDRPEPRYLVNRTCQKMGLPYVFGAAVSTYGNVSTFVPGQTLCLECFMAGISRPQRDCFAFVY